MSSKQSGLNVEDRTEETNSRAQSRKKPSRNRGRNLFLSADERIGASHMHHSDAKV